MPTLDNCHPQVVNALRKAGWEITHQSYFIALEDFSIVPDIRARKTNGQRDEIIIIEVKCFSDRRAEQDEFYRAVGQYIFYRSALRMKPIHGKLYMAVPLDVYNHLFMTEVVTGILKDAEIHVLVVDINREEIIQWLG